MEGLRSARALSSSVYWDGMTDQNPERCQAGYPVKCHTEQFHTAFFPDFSPATAIRRKACGPVLKKMTAPWSPALPHLSGGVIKLRHKGNREASIPLRKRRILSAPCLSRSRMPQLCGGTTGEQRPLFLQPSGRSLTAGMDMVLAAREGMMPGWTWTLAKPIFCFFFSPLFYWDIVPIYSVQRSLCWQGWHSFFSFFGGD